MHFSNKAPARYSSSDHPNNWRAVQPRLTIVSSDRVCDSELMFPSAKNFEFFASVLVDYRSQCERRNRRNMTLYSQPVHQQITYNQWLSTNIAFLNCPPPHRGRQPIHESCLHRHDRQSFSDQGQAEDARIMKEISK